MAWNYRVTRIRLGAGEMRYAIREVHYTLDGRPRSWTEEVTGPSGETAQECREDHALMGEAYTRPVLDITDAAHPFEVEEPTQAPTGAASDVHRRQVEVQQRAMEYLVAGLEVGLPDHEHLLATREDVDAGDDFECPLCAFVDGLVDDLTHAGPPDAMVAFAEETPVLNNREAWTRLARIARDWLVRGLDRSPGSFRGGPGEELPDPADLGVTMRAVVAAASDKTNTPAEALARVWSGWTVHRMVTGTRRNTTAVLSRGGYVALVRMYSWDYWVYTVREVGPAHWHLKTVEERAAILIDCVQTAALATSVSGLLGRVASAGMVTTKGLAYAQRAKALAEREVRAAFPTGAMPDTGDSVPH